MRSLLLSYAFISVLLSLIGNMFWPEHLSRTLSALRMQGLQPRPRGLSIWLPSAGYWDLSLLSVMPLQALCTIFIRHTFDSDQPEHKGLLRSKTYGRILVFTLGFHSFIGSHLFTEHLLGMGSKFITDHNPRSPGISLPKFRGLAKHETGMWRMKVFPETKSHWHAEMAGPSG